MRTEDDDQAGTSQRIGTSLRALVASEFGTGIVVLGLTAVVLLSVIPLAPQIVSPGNLSNILSNVWPLLLIVTGQVFVLITGGIDLAQTATMALTNVVVAMLITEGVDGGNLQSSPFWGTLFGPNGGAFGSGSLSVVAALCVMLLLGASIGALNGFAVARIGMPPFMVTLSTMLLFTAVAIWSTQSENVRNLPETYTSLGSGWVAAPLALVAAVVAHLVLSRTVLGQWLYAVGVNKVAAEVSGVPVSRVILTAYVLSGTFTAMGAALYSARLDAGRPTLGSELLLDVIGAAVIGGVSLRGGRGRIMYAAFGVLFFVVLSNALNLLGLEFYTIMWIKGLVILGAVGLDTLRTHTSRRRRTV